MAESKTSDTFYNAKIAIPIQHILMQLGYEQPLAPLKTGKSATKGFAHDKIYQKRLKS